MTLTAFPCPATVPPVMTRFARRAWPLTSSIRVLSVMVTGCCAVPLISSSTELFVGAKISCPFGSDTPLISDAKMISAESNWTSFAAAIASRNWQSPVVRSVQSAAVPTSGSRVLSTTNTAPSAAPTSPRVATRLAPAPSDVRCIHFMLFPLLLLRLFPRLLALLLGRARDLLPRLLLALLLVHRRRLGRRRPCLLRREVLGPS